MTDRREIPDTPLFDRELNRQGYALNKYAMSLGRPDNRAAYKADEAKRRGAVGVISRAVGPNAPAGICSAGRFAPAGRRSVRNQSRMPMV